MIELNARAVAANAVSDIAMPAKLRAIITDRIECVVIESVARARRLMRTSMKTRRHGKPG